MLTAFFRDTALYRDAAFLEDLLLYCCLYMLPNQMLWMDCVPIFMPQTDRGLFIIFVHCSNDPNLVCFLPLMFVSETKMPDAGMRTYTKYSGVFNSRY